MSKIEITRTELVWHGKYDENGGVVPPRRVDLPFQVIESVNETRATRQQKDEQRAGHVATLFDYWQAEKEQTTVPGDGWRNKLIWGDNLYVMGSLLENIAGKIDLIYIDPPFATGADFSFKANIGEQAIEKVASAIEEKAYRDTWGQGLDSYLKMLYERLSLMHDLLASSGSIFVHVGSNINHMVRGLMDEIFGQDNFRNEIILPGRAVKNLQQQFESIQRLQVRHDVLLWYTVSTETRFSPQWIRKHGAGNPEGHWHHFWSTAERPTMRYELFGYTPQTGQWVWKKERALKAVKNFERFLEEGGGRTLAEYWRDTGKTLSFIRPSPDDGKPQYWRAPAEMRLADTVWSGIPIYSNKYGYPTEKNSSLIEQILDLAAIENSLIADFFCGSGVTLSVAESLGHRWIGCDLGRYAIHTARKRLLDIEGCKSFEILNLGQYERQVWQGVTFAGKKQTQQMLIFEYLKFILELYGAQPLAGTQHLHGKKGAALVHIGAVDAPVTIDEINACLVECKEMKQKELHVLGWEWEMGLANIMIDEAKARGVKLLLLTIPREVMEQQAVDKGDIHFYELAYLETDIQVKDREATVELTDFIIPNDELIPPEVRQKIKKWSDYVDYWAVDWDFQNDTFVNQWTSYRTRRDRGLKLKTEPHKYPEAGAYRILVKVIDIFGNDTSQAFTVEVK